MRIETEWMNLSRDRYSFEENYNMTCISGLATASGYTIAQMKEHKRIKIMMSSTPVKGAFSGIVTKANQTGHFDITFGEITRSSCSVCDALVKHKEFNKKIDKEKSVKLWFWIGID